MARREFAEVYDEQVRRVYGFFAYRLSSRADAEDLTQATFERALRAWHRYDETRASAAMWLLVIARNVLIDHVRRVGVTPLQPGEQADMEAIVAAPDRHSLGLDPDLERALEDLGARGRELIALRFGGDLSGAEIAALTGLSLANVQQILSRSLRQMRAGLEAASGPIERVGLR